MIAISRSTNCAKGVLLIVSALAAFVLSPITAQAQTKVTREGECAFTIHIPLEIYGPNATPELAARWKRNIEIGLERANRRDGQKNK